MKYIVAFISSFIMFVMTWLLVAIPLAVLIPYTQTRIVFEYMVTNIASLVGFILGGLVATQTFRASLKAKTGKLYREDQEDGSEKKNRLRMKGSVAPSGLSDSINSFPGVAPPAK